jgi:uncharacterized protein
MDAKPNLAGGSVSIDLRGLGDGTVPFDRGAPGQWLALEGETDQAFRDFRIEGSLTRDGAILRLRGVLRGVLESACDRCLGRFMRPMDVEFDVRAILGGEEASGTESELEDEGGDSPIPLPADAAIWDLTSVLREAVLLEIPIKNLCREDCAGLCPRCGANRNDELCSCETAPRDPRWAALGKLNHPSADQES